MLHVVRVDQITRIVLPESQWALDVREKLTQMGHTLEDLGTLPGDSHAIMRDDAELARMHALLAATGL